MNYISLEQLEMFSILSKIFSIPIKQVVLLKIGSSSAMMGYKLVVIEIIPNSATTVFNIFFTINTLN
jgi:hypothetical protein